MNRFTKFSAIVAALATAGLTTAMAANVLTGKQIMQMLNKGPNALTMKLGKALQVNPPDWDQIQGQAKEYVQLTADFAKTEPHKGAADSWAKLTKAYTDTALALDDAAQKKDKTAALAARAKLRSSCTACHRAHR